MSQRKSLCVPGMKAKFSMLKQHFRISLTLNWLFLLGSLESWYLFTLKLFSSYCSSYLSSIKVSDVLVILWIQMLLFETFPAYS